MPLKAIDHVTVRCADLERSRAFYRDILGLTDGPRPAFGFPGAWFYLGDRPVVHLFTSDAEAAATSTGAFDHMAFEAEDIDDTISRLERVGVPHRRNLVPGGRLEQVFVHDPDGIMIELNFRC